MTDCDALVEWNQYASSTTFSVNNQRVTPLSVNFTKWSNTLKQFVGNFSDELLSVFHHFVGLALKGLTTARLNKWIASRRYHFDILYLDFYKAINISVLSTPPINRLYKATEAGRATVSIFFCAQSEWLHSSIGTILAKLDMVRTLPLLCHAQTTTFCSVSTTSVMAPLPCFFMSFTVGIGQLRLRLAWSVATP